ALTQKVFANMRRVGKGFSGVETPLFEGMLVAVQPAEEGLVANQVQVNDAVAAANDNAAQKLVIIKLKERVKRLEKANMVKSSKLRRLRKVGASKRVESSDDMEDVFNQGRMIDDIDMNEGIELVKDAEVAESEGRHTAQHAEKQAEIYNLDLDHSLKVLIVAAYTKRRKGVTIRDPEEELSLKTPAETPKKGNGRRRSGDYQNINETPAQKAAKRRKLSEEAQEAEDLRMRLEVVEDEDDDVFVEATPLASKVPVVDYQIVLIDNKPRFKIIRADETHQFYISFTTLLKNFNRDDLENLWRIVKDRFSTSKPTKFLDEYLLLTLKTMFEEPDGQDAIWRNQKSVHGLALVKRWKLLTSCAVHVITLLTVQLFLLVERRYPLLRFTLEQLVNVTRLQVK
nr:hypothetical protein [Tanacetum cinerariifolium]